MKWFISDMHLGHSHVLDYDNRPFQNVHEMQEQLICNWNGRVHNKDAVYILGDMCWNTTTFLEVLPLLHGELHLIKGNHDKVNLAVQKYFAEVVDYKYLRLDDTTAVALSHYPIASWRNMRHGVYHFYGHVHDTEEYLLYLQYKKLSAEQGFELLAYNVGCMLPYMGYCPQTFETIIAEAPKYEEVLLNNGKD